MQNYFPIKRNVRIAGKYRSEEKKSVRAAAAVRDREKCTAAAMKALVRTAAPKK